MRLMVLRILRDGNAIRLSSCLLLLLLISSFHQPRVEAAQPFINPMKHDVVLVTPKAFDSLISSLRNNDGVGMLLHFKGTDAGQKRFINNVYDAAAKDVKGMIRFGAVDCNEWPTFCQAHLNPEVVTPLIVVYPPNPVPAAVVEGKDAKSIVNAALRYIPGNHVTALNEQNVDRFLGSDLAIPKVLLFTKKDSTPVLFKALSNAFKDRLSFGLVPSSMSSLMNRYKVKDLPSLMILRAATKGDGLGKPLVYTGKEMAYGVLHEWLNIHAETFVKGGGFVDALPTETPPKPWISQRVPEVTGPSHHDICFKGSSLCVMLLTKGPMTAEQQTIMEQLEQKYSASTERGARFKFMWLNAEIEVNFREMINLNISSAVFPSLVVFNPHKRIRFLALPADQEATLSSITSLLERIASGDGRFTNVKKLPAFAPRDAEGQPVQKKEEL